MITMLATMLLAVTQRVPVLGPLPAFPEETMEPAVRRQFEAARGRLEAAPLDGDANGALGMLYHAYGYFGLAEPCYRRAGALDPRPRWSFYLGLVLQERGQWAASAAALGGVLGRKPDDIATLLLCADADTRRNRLDEAIRGYRQVNRLSPSTPQAWCGAGRVNLRRGMLDAAVDDLSEAIRLHPDYGTARYLLGQTLRKLGRLDEAAEQLALASEQRDEQPALDDPRLAALSALRTGAVDALHRGIDLLRAGRVQPAIELLREAVRINAKLAEAHSQLGAALLTAGDLVAAERSLRRAVLLDSSFADAHYNLGLVAHRRGDYELAVEHFRETVSIRPGHFDAHLGLGTDLAGTGDRAAAIVHLRRSMALRPSDPRPSKRLAGILASDLEYEGAIGVLRAAMRRLPDDASIADRLAWLLATCPVASLRDPHEALRLADEVCRRTGSSVPQALDTRAAALAGLGRFAEAVAAAGEALALATAGGKADLAAEIESRLAIYRSHRPFNLPGR